MPSGPPQAQPGPQQRPPEPAGHVPRPERDRAAGGSEELSQTSADSHETAGARLEANFAATQGVLRRAHLRPQQRPPMPAWQASDAQRGWAANETEVGVQSHARGHGPATARLGEWVAVAQAVQQQAQPRPQQRPPAPTRQQPKPHGDALDAARSSESRSGGRRVAGARPAGSTLRPQNSGAAGTMDASKSFSGGRKSTAARPAEASALRHARGEPHAPVQELPVVPHVVVVEGQGDAAAVRRAVRADVFILGGAQEPATLGGLRQLLAQRGSCPRDVIVLLDPDFAGRQGRQALDAALPGCRHAFVPVPSATSASATRCAARAVTSALKFAGAAPFGC